MVPWVSCATESPTRVENVNMLLTSLAERLFAAPVLVQMQRLGVHHESGEQEVVGLGDRPARTVLVEGRSAAVAVGRAAAEKIGRVAPAHVIARPHDEIPDIFERPPVR